MIGKVGTNQADTAYRSSREEVKVSEASAQTQSGSSGDTLILGTTVQKASDTYTKTGTVKPDTAEVERLKQEAADAMKNLRNYVAQSLLGQNGGQKLNKDVVAQAQQAISKDGYWGEDAVSDRIVAFAKAISGNDKSKLDSLKSAIEKGFEEAGVKLGKLPDISSRTHDEVMKKLDAWANESDDETANQ